MDDLGKRLAIAVTLVLFLPLIIVSVSVKAQTTGSIVINPDGSVTGTYSIEQVASTYTLTANISGNIQVERSNIIINGAGYILDGNGMGGIDLTNNVQHEYSNPTISNVTIENMYLTNGGIITNGGGNNTFYNDFFANCSQRGFAIQLMDCSYNNISYCTFDSESQISMDYSANFNTVTESNLPSYGILVWLSGTETVDRNYWSDYSTKYPNATEVDHSGVGNTPYVFYTVNNNGKLLDVFEDNYPLMKPVTIPLIVSNPQTNIPEVPAAAILPMLLLSIFSIVVILRHRKKQIQKAQPKM